MFVVVALPAGIRAQPHMSHAMHSKIKYEQSNDRWRVRDPLLFLIFNKVASFLVKHRERKCEKNGLLRLWILIAERI